MSRRHCNFLAYSISRSTRQRGNHLEASWLEGCGKT